MSEVIKIMFVIAFINFLIKKGGDANIWDM
jgi:hypothetical protein